MPQFTATIYKLGINPVVDPPENILSVLFDQAGKSKAPISVRGKLNGAEFTQTLVKYAGEWRLYINGQMLKDSGLQVGDEAKIEIEFDPRLREVRVPRQLTSALQRDEIARAAFDRLAPSRRKEILRYLGSLKTSEAIDKNVARVVAHLRGEKQDQVLTRPRRAK